MSGEGGGKLTLRAIEVFVAVIEEGSLAAGAKRLGLSPSSVSQQIANLETALGASLIDRRARPFAMTPAGYLFQRRALTILDEAARARAELAELELSTLSQLRLAIVEDMDAEVTPELVAQLSDVLPGCNVVARAGPSHENLAALEGRAVDLVVAADSDYPADWIERHALLRDPYVLITAKGLLDLDGDVTAQLLSTPMVRYANTQIMGRQIEAHLRRLRLAPPRRYEFDSNHGVLAMTANRRCWAIVTPTGYLRAPRFHDAIDVMALPFPSFSRNLSLYSRRDTLGSLPTRAAVLLRQLLQRRCVDPAVALFPWLAGSLRVLGEEGPEPGPKLKLVES